MMVEKDTRLQLTNILFCSWQEKSTQKGRGENRIRAGVAKEANPSTSSWAAISALWLPIWFHKADEASIEIWEAWGRANARHASFAEI
jgi:hypothetical protein